MFNGSAMKKIVLILVIVMFSSLAAAIVLYIVDGGDGLPGGFGYYRGDSSEKGKAANNARLDEEKQENLSGIDSIVVNDISEDIKFIPVDTTDSIKAHFYGEYSSSNKNYKPELIVEKSGSTINIKINYPKISINFNCWSNSNLDIYIPRSFSGNLKVSTTSANTDIDEMNLKSFKYNTISGKLTAKTINSGITELHSTSGASYINGSMDSFVYSSISGEMDSDNFKAEMTKINVTSADVSIKGNPGNTSFNSVSGGLLLDCSEKLAADITSNTTSADVKIKLPSDSEFGINYSSTSGDIKCEFPVTITGTQREHKLAGKVGSDSNIIKANSISGDLEIMKK